MATFRLGTYQLSSAEAGLVRALLKLMSGGDAADFNWSFANEAPYDALIVDAVSLAAGSAPQHDDVSAVLMLTDINVSPLAAPNTLFRPIRAEQLRAWLLQTQRKLAQSRGNPPFSTGKMIAAEPPAKQPAHGHRFKLRRWPPTALLQRDQRRVRMATLLSKRLVTVGELAEISQESEDRCQAFLSLLQSFDLLEIQQQPVTPLSAPPSPSHRNTSVRPNRDKSGKQGLVDSIRRRLGL